MGLEQKIAEGMKAAMKSGDQLRLDTLRSLRAGILELKKMGGARVMSPEDEFKLLNQNAKKRKDAMEMYKKGGREDLFEQEEQELEIIKEFLPEQMTIEEISNFVTSAIESLGAVEMKDFGKVMGFCMKELKGKADGTVIQNLVKEKLGG